MTTQYTVLKGLPNGLALDAGKLFTLASPDTVVTGNTFSFSNRTNANTQYVVSIVRATPLPAGDYTFIAYIGTSPKVEVALTFTGVDGETATETPPTVELDSAITNQLDGIEDSIAAYIAGIAASASLTPGTIVGFPETLNIGDSYTDDCDSAIHVFIRDDNDDPITAVGTHDFTDGDFAPECIITLNGNTGRVKCEVEYVTASPENYLKIQIPSKESRRATPGVSTVQVLLKWDGAQKALSKQTVTWEGLI